MSTTQAIGFESALRAYMADCLKDKKCPFQGTVDDAMGDLAALLASVDRSPQKNADGRMLGADTLMTSIVSALYSQDSWSYLTESLTGVLKGDPPSVAFQLADFYNNRQDGSYADNSTEAFRAYNCMDYPLENDPAAKAASDAKIAAEAPTIAPYWDAPDPCEEWPYPPTGTRGEITAAGSGPILVVGTTNDPATPYAWAESLAKQLEGGILITRSVRGGTPATTRATRAWTTPWTLLRGRHGSGEGGHPLRVACRVPRRGARGSQHAHGQGKIVDRAVHRMRTSGCAPP